MFKVLALESRFPWLLTNILIPQVVVHEKFHLNLATNPLAENHGSTVDLVSIGAC